MWRFEMKDGVISIHALRKESDTVTWRFGNAAAYFNPRSP